MEDDLKIEEVKKVDDDLKIEEVKKVDDDLKIEEVKKMDDDLKIEKVKEVKNAHLKIENLDADRSRSVTITSPDDLNSPDIDRSRSVSILKPSPQNLQGYMIPFKPSVQSFPRNFSSRAQWFLLGKRSLLGFENQKKCKQFLDTVETKKPQSFDAFKTILKKLARSAYYCEKAHFVHPNPEWKVKGYYFFGFRTKYAERFFAVKSEVEQTKWTEALKVIGIISYEEAKNNNTLWKPNSNSLEVIIARTAELTLKMEQAKAEKENKKLEKKKLEEEKEKKRLEEKKKLEEEKEKKEAPKSEEKSPVVKATRRRYM